MKKRKQSSLGEWLLLLPYILIALGTLAALLQAAGV